MGRIYTATFEEVAVSAAQDLFEVIAPSNGVVVVHGLMLTQSSDAGDAQSEQLNILIHRGTATGTGGTSVTPRTLDVGDSAFGGTCEANNTTQSVEGAFIHAENFNVMAGLAIWWTPETRPVLSPSGLFIVELQTTPADSLTMSGTLYFEEIGG